MNDLHLFGENTFKHAASRINGRHLKNVFILLYERRC